MKKEFAKMIQITCLVFVAMLVVVMISVKSSAKKQTSAEKQQTTQTTQKKVTNKKANTSVMNEVNWQKSSEKVDYPDLDKYPDAWIHVDIAKQRVYIMNGNDILYTMYCSTGSGGDNATPTGTYYIQERGASFYSQSSGEGANYWVSWKDHGIYLFHTVPVDENGNYIKSEAEALGKSANSHGCVRLSIPDAKWIYENVPEGMKVSITEE